MVNNLIIDFDSTIIADEMLEIMLAEGLSDDPMKQKKMEEIARITDAGMNGEIPFEESLSRRVELLDVNADLIELVTEKLSHRISRSFIETVDTLNDFNLNIVSGGFKEIIERLMNPLGIESSRIHANSFVYERGKFKGVDLSNPLSRDNGKVETVRRLGLSGTTVAVGDGFSDLQLKINNEVQYFFYYSEFVNRIQVRKRADVIVNNFHQVLESLNLDLEPNTQIHLAST